jgi:hypothetical protein
MILKNLLREKARTFITILGISVGVMAIIVGGFSRRIAGWIQLNAFWQQGRPCSWAA